MKEEGHRVGQKRVARLMRAAGIVGVCRRRRGGLTRRAAEAQPIPDLVERDFSAAGPDQLWVADITYVPTWAGFLYLAVVVDAWSRRVVGWSMATHLGTELVLSALEMALWRRRPEAVIHHSDQGCQYTSIAFGQRCREAGVQPSTGSVGDCFAPAADGIVMSAESPPPEDPEDQYGVYGVHFAGATSHGQLLNSDSHGLRHMSDAAWSDLEDAEGEVVLGRICGVFWSLVRGCRAFDSVSSGFGPHGCGRFFDFIDCQAFNPGYAGFSTRVSYTRFINCRAESAGSVRFAFDIGGGVQEGTGPQDEGSAYGGQNPLVGCEMVNCTQVGFMRGLFRVCNMSSLTIRDSNLDLPQRLDGSNPYYWFFGHFDYSSPRLWQANWRYLPGDWVRDSWEGSGSWHYKIYECKLAHTAETPPHELWPINDYWVEIDGTEDRPSLLRGKLVIRNCRFIHQGSGWYYSGLYPDTGFFGPFVFPELVQLDAVEMSPAWREGHYGMYLWAFRVYLQAWS